MALSPELAATVDRMCWNADQLGRFRRALRSAGEEGRNVLSDATDDQAAAIEKWAIATMGADWFMGAGQAEVRSDDA